MTSTAHRTYGRVHTHDSYGLSVFYALLALLVGVSASAAATPAKGPAVITARIQQQIDQLKAETPDESLTRLADVAMFYWPGYVADGSMALILPLEPELDERHLRMVLSNRRFLKVCQDFAQLDKDQAAALISRHLDSALRQYKTLFDEAVRDLAQIRSRGPATQRSTSGLSVQIGNNADGTPTMEGLRLKVLALVLAAGHLELRAARPAVQAVVDEALAQRQRFIANKELGESDGFVILVRSSLYNRRILASGLLGTASDAVVAEQRAIELGIAYESERLTHFDAPVTRYDGVRGAPGKLDYSGGEIIIRYVPAISDDKFESLRRAAGPSAATRPAGDGR